MSNKPPQAKDFEYEAAIHGVSARDYDSNIWMAIVEDGKGGEDEIGPYKTKRAALIAGITEARAVYPEATSI